MTVKHNALTGADLHEPKGVASASSGQVYVADGAASGAWSNYLATNLDLTGITNGDFLYSNAGTVAGETLNNANRVAITTQIDDISGTNSGYVVAPLAGDIIACWSVIDGAINTSDTVLTGSINGVNMTDGTITIATAGSAAGDRDSATPSANNTVAAGDAIRFLSDGATGSAVKAVITILIDTAD